MEVSKFPDKDIVVDDEYNGEHLTNADKFLPPSPPPVDRVLDDETGHEMEIVLEDTPAAPQQATLESTTAHEKQVSMIASSSENRALTEQSPHSLAVRRGSMVEEVEEATGPPSVVDQDKPRLTVVTDMPAEMQLDRSHVPSPTPEQTIVVESAAAPADESQVIRLTPVAVVPVISQTLYDNDPPPGSKERIVRMSALGLASPEEGELSPGFTFSKDVSSQRIPFKPIEMTSLEVPETSEMTKREPEPSTTEDVAFPDVSSIANTESALTSKDCNQEEESAISTEEKPVEKAPKLSLTIRIPNIKAETLDSATKKREGVAPLMAEDSEASSDDDETIGEEPLNEEEDLVTESLVPAAGEEIQRPDLSRKRPFRDSPAAGEEAPPPKKRIHLKNLDRVETPIEKRDQREDSTFDEAAVMGTLLTLRGGLVTNDSVQSKLDATMASEEPLKVPAPEFSEAPSEKPNREVNKISISLRRPSFEPELGEIDAAAPSHPLKMKRKKDLSERAVSPIPRANSPHARATSPKPRGARRSPGNTRRSPATLRSDLPAPMSAEPKAGVEASKPVSKPVSKPATMIATALGMDDPTSNEKRSLVLTGSKNSAFERKQPIGSSKDEEEDETQVSETGSTILTDGDLVAAEGKLTSPKARDRSKASDDSQPAIRSGRRAAQQAKDKLNNKQDAPGMEGGKKKKKRRRKDGKESGDEGESENSEDDRQWVQCDSCGKWRILPSRIKVSSLPKHWYCDMNTYDPKRNNCEAPEQTAKQVAKERKRAKKRARQRLEQAELEGIPDETKKEKRARMEAAKEAPTITLNSPRTKDESPPKEMNGVPGEREPKNKTKRLSPAPEVSKEEAQASDSGSDHQKDEKKALGGKKSKTLPKEEKLPEVEVAEVMAEILVDAPKGKPGRRRGRPRNPTKESRGSGQESKDEGENVEWVQCEKCEKWRKLPSHICADELPDVWYCSLNTWNADSASCESPEDKADALHQDVGNGSAVPGNPGKFSYRGLIFGTGRKHNRPMSERTRATESLFAKPVDDADNPYPVVMYAKSSAFLPRTSNFTKGNQVEEKCIGIFDIMSNSELWAELRGVGQPMTILSGGGEQSNKMHYTYESLPDDVQKTMSELILHALGSATLTGDEVLSLTQCRQWENVPPAWLELRNFCTEDIVVNTLLQLVRDGVVEMTCSREADRAMSEWVPKYRLVRSRRRTEIDEAMKSSRCMKIAKPWKLRESDSQWVSGGM
jgi:hypothetical protein